RDRVRQHAVFTRRSGVHRDPAGTSERARGDCSLPVRTSIGVRMQRSKQQALMFLLGAVLVGGVLGFSADRVLGHDRFAAQYGPRARFYDELGLSRTQRATLDSLAVEKDCEIRTLLK